MENFGDRSRDREKINNKNEETHPKTPRAWFQSLPPPLGFDLSSLLLLSLWFGFHYRDLFGLISLFFVFMGFWVSSFFVFCLCVLGFFVWSSWVSWFDLCFLPVCLCTFVCLKFWFLGYLLWNSSLTDSSSTWIS